jgi:hypothetical protein
MINSPDKFKDFITNTKLNDNELKKALESIPKNKDGEINWDEVQVGSARDSGDGFVGILSFNGRYLEFDATQFNLDEFVEAQFPKDDILENDDSTVEFLVSKFLSDNAAIIIDQIEIYAHEHQYVFYTYKAWIVCANFDISAGEEYVTDVRGLGTYSNVSDIMSDIVWGEIVARCIEALNEKVRSLMIESLKNRF